MGEHIRPIYMAIVSIRVRVRVGKNEADDESINE